MVTRGRIVVLAAVLVLAAGSAFAGVRVGRTDTLPRDEAARARAAVEARLAALEAMQAELAGGRDRLAGLDQEITGLRKTIESDSRSVTVTGESYLPSSLRVVTLAIELHDTGPSVERSIERVRNLATGVTSAARSKGIAAGDIRTTWGGTYRDWQHRERFTSTAQVLVTIRDTNRIDRVLKAARAVSEKEVGFGSLTVSDEADEDALAEARQEALAEARERAQQYARAIGRRLGPVLTVSEQVAPDTAPATPGDGEGYYYRPSFIVVVGVVYELA